VAGEGQNIELAPVPLLGSVDVITTPAGAEIVINGKSCGISPNSVNNLPVGEHNLQITLPGYTQVDKMIVVAEGKVTEVNENLIVAAKVKSGTSKDKTAMNKGKINQQKVKKETVTIPEKQPDVVHELKQDTMPAVRYNKEFYKYKSSKNFWLISCLTTLSCGTFAYLRSGTKYTEYQSVTNVEGATALHSKVQTFDTVYPVCFALAGLSAVQFFLKSGKMRKAKEQKISFSPQPVRNGAGLGLVYNF
jgi:hypothetical protein